MILVMQQVVLSSHYAAFKDRVSSRTPFNAVARQVEDGLRLFMSLRSPDIGKKAVLISDVSY